MDHLQHEQDDAARHSHETEILLRRIPSRSSKNAAIAAAMLAQSLDNDNNSEPSPTSSRASSRIAKMVGSRARGDSVASSSSHAQGLDYSDDEDAQNPDSNNAHNDDPTIKVSLTRSRSIKARSRRGSSPPPPRPSRSRRRPPIRSNTTTATGTSFITMRDNSDSENTIPASSVPPSALSANLPSHLPQLSAKENTRVEALLLSSTLSSPAAVEITSSSSSSSYFPGTTSGTTLSDVDTALDTPPLPLHEEVADYEATMRIPRRFLTQPSAVPGAANRDSEYSAISENEIWQRQHEEDQEGITARYNPHRNSTKSGMFDLELELDASTRASQIRDNGEEQVQEGDSMDLIPPPSPGCGLGITSDDAIHPEHAYAPIVSRAPISPAPGSAPQQVNTIPMLSDSSLEYTRQSGYFGQQPTSANITSSGGYVSGTASPQSFVGSTSSPFNDGSPASSIYVHGGHTPGLEGVLPGTGNGTSSRWSTSRNYVRRNTGNSIRGNGLYKAPSQQSLRDGNATGITPQAQLPAQIVQEGRETPQAGLGITRKDSQSAVWRLTSRTNSFNNHNHKASPSGVGIAGIDTILPEQHSISSPFSPSGTSTSSTSFARLQKGRTSTRSRGPSISAYSNSSSSPYAQGPQHKQAEGDARLSYAESSISRRTTDSFISTASTNENDAADSRRSSMLSTAGATGQGNLYELESELEEILLSNGEMGTFSSLSPVTSSPPVPSKTKETPTSLSNTARIGQQQQQHTPHEQARGLGLMSFETSNGGEDRISKEIEGQAVHLAESGRGKIVQLAKGQLIENLLVPSGTTHLILSGCTQVRELDLMLRSTLPSLVSSLLVLDISSCGLPEIPDIISICSHLEELNISCNPLKSGTLPSFLIYNKALRVLLADNCELTNLSPRGRSASISGLNSLHTLSIRGNYLRALPSWLQSLEENLEIFLIDGNPFYGAYADLAKPLLARPATLPLTASSATSSTLASPAISKHNIAAQDNSPSLSELYSDSRESVVDEPSFPSTTSGGALSPWNELSPSSDRSSFMSRRAKSFRTGLRKASGKSPNVNNDDSDTSNNSSRVNSLLLADIEGKASGHASKRASILRPMRSTGDLTAPQPSIQSLVESSAAMDLPSQPSSSAFYTRSTFSPSITDTEDLPLPSPTPQKRARKTSRAQMTVSEFFRFGDHASPKLPVPSPKDIVHALARDNPSMSEFENAVDLESAAEDEGGDTLKQQRGRKPSFFKKFSSNAAEKLGKLQRKPSTPALRKVRKQSPRVLDDFNHEEGEEGGGIEDRMSQITLGNGKPPRAPFLSEDNRSASDPLAAKPSSSRLPSLPPSRSESPKQSMRGTRGSSKPRAPKLSKPPPPASRSGSLSKSGNLAAGSLHMEKRRSYLLLNATLPPMISPGPLQVSFSRSSHEETQVPFSTEDQTITIPRDLARQDNSATPVPSPFVLDNLSIEERKAALRPLMAYIRDLDELSQEAELYHDNEYNSSVPPSAAVSRAVSRKPSLAAVSSVSASSNRIDSSSGYDSTALTSPSSYQSPSKLKDNPVKRERVIQEILSSEKSYLTGLQDLVTLYIEPASAPYRSSSSVTAVRETIIPQVERKLVFSVAESIEQFHAAVFLPALENATAQLFTERKSVTSLDQSILAQAVNSIAEVFSRHAAYLKLYHSYCLNFDTAMNRFALWKSIGSGGSMIPVSGAQLPSNDSKGTLAGLSTSQRKRIRHVLKSAKRDPRHLQIDLQSYLLLPIQRIPRYKLLLESLVECTPSPHDPSQPHPALSAALETVAQLASEMNEKKRESEGRHRLLHWQERLGASFKSPLVQPHRMLLKEGSITLTRVVKRKSDIIPNTLDPTQEKASALQIHCLVIDNTMKRMAYILCNDVLVLGHLLGDPLSGPVELWTCLRLGRAIGGSEDPASIFGSANMLRIVDARAILYLTCPDHAKALELVNLINQQSRQANHGVV